MQDQFGGSKLVGKDSMLLRVASILGRGSLNAGTFVAQVFHWFYVGRPRATTSYRACINVLLSSEKVHLNLLRKMTEAHSILTVFNACKHRSQVESTCTQNYHVTSLDQLSIRARLPAVA